MKARYNILEDANYIPENGEFGTFDEFVFEPKKVNKVSQKYPETPAKAPAEASAETSAEVDDNYYPEEKAGEVGEKVIMHMKPRVLMPDGKTWVIQGGRAEKNFFKNNPEYAKKSAPETEVPETPAVKENAPDEAETSPELKENRELADDLEREVKEDFEEKPALNVPGTERKPITVDDLKPKKPETPGRRTIASGFDPRTGKLLSREEREKEESRFKSWVEAKKREKREEKPETKEKRREPIAWGARERTEKPAESEREDVESRWEVVKPERRMPQVETATHAYERAESLGAKLSRVWRESKTAQRLKTFAFKVREFNENSAIDLSEAGMTRRERARKLEEEMNADERWREEPRGGRFKAGSMDYDMPYERKFGV